MTKFLFLPETTKVLAHKCINTIVKLENNLAEKEEKYGGWRRMTIKNCMDAMTTSPADYHNRVIKHGPNQTNGKYYLDKSISKMTKSSINRLQERIKTTTAERCGRNYASDAPISDYLIRKVHALVDHNHDRLCHPKLAKLGLKHWITWNCDVIDHTNIPHPLTNSG